MNSARFAEAYCRRYGLALVPLPPRTKRPLADDWGRNVITDAEAAAQFWQQHPDWNIGAALGPSRLCSLDVDDHDGMQAVAAEFGFDIEALREAPTIQGAAKGYRVMFRVPDGVTLGYHALTWPKRGGEGRYTVFELRAACDGQQRQDVLPPSIHPDTGRPYVWLTRPNGQFPEPPPWLLALWANWEALKPQLQAACPWAPKREVPRAPPAVRSRAGASVIDEFNQRHDIRAALVRYGYTPSGRRYLSPHSHTHLAGVTLFDDNRCWIHHASDPLCSVESGRPVGPFDLYCQYEHAGDVKAAVRAAGEAMGLARPQRARRPVPPPADEHGEIVLTDPVPGFATWDELGLDLDGRGRPHQNLDNAVRAIERHPEIRGRIWYDEFLDAIVSDWQGPLRRWRDADDVKLQLYLQRHVGLTKIGVNTCHDAALVAALHDIRNECRAWIEAQAWDGVSRLDELMQRGFGADDTEYTRAVGRCWMISMAARVMTPGCKVDTVPVLEGTQGAGKSSALAALGGKWFVECHETVTSKDFYGVLQGHMLVEISEMHSFTRAEVERIKGIISCQVDRYRKSYGRNAEDHPRQTVLVCTTNRDDWQRDDTGARRFWPIRCGAVDLEWIRVSREQLFAEALDAFRRGVPWWDVPVEEQQRQAHARRSVDVWEPLVLAWVTGKTWVRIDEVMRDCLRIESGHQSVADAARVQRILRTAGWESKLKRVGNDVFRAWVLAGVTGVTCNGLSY